MLKLLGIKHAYEVRHVPVVNPFAPAGSWRVVACYPDGREEPILDMYQLESHAQGVADSLNEAYKRGVGDGARMTAQYNAEVEERSEGENRMSTSPTNCIKCEHCVERIFRDRVDPLIVTYMYSCKQAPMAFRGLPLTIVGWRSTQRRRITPPAWCPLREEGQA